MNNRQCHCFACVILQCSCACCADNKLRTIGSVEIETYTMKQRNIQRNKGGAKRKEEEERGGRTKNEKEERKGKDFSSSLSSSS
jgi:hypothetical protein